ncbi:hypothetical protein Tco_1553852 [Tanacetum coccineum]
MAGFNIHNILTIWKPNLESCTQIAKLQRKPYGNNTLRLLRSHFRNANLEIVIEGYPAGSSQETRKVFWNAIYELRTYKRPKSMPPKRTSTSKAPAMTQAAIKKLVADSVSAALEA